MRQVPHYAIIGNGRMAKHFCHYLDQLQLNYSQWSRAENTAHQLKSIIANATHLLLLISDGAIDNFIITHNLSAFQHLTLIHFSGSLHSKYAYSAHPLQTFPPQLYTLSDYQKIPFIIEDHAPTFQQLLPGLTNPHYPINAADKPYYHALCVMANNFTTLLWQKYFAEMQTKFHINPIDLKPFLNQTLENIARDPKTALTGPIQRKDKETLQRNLNALSNDKFFNIFKTFVTTFVEEDQ